LSDTHTLVPTRDDAHADCRALTDVLARIGDKWTVMVVGVLSQGPMRYSQILKVIDGISQRMLTLTLKGLERDGLVTRTVYPTNPPRVDYTLTERGHTLTVPLRELWEWARANKSAIDESRRQFEQGRRSGPLSALLQKLPHAADRAD
jgi:DNA-binding HxlR family transcriptional regulator